MLEKGKSIIRVHIMSYNNVKCHQNIIIIIIIIMRIIIKMIMIIIIIIIIIPKSIHLANLIPRLYYPG